MKIKQEKTFTPVTLTLESQEEVDELYAAVNFSPLLEAFPFGGTLSQIQQGLEKYRTYAYKPMFETLKETMHNYRKS